MAPTRQTKYLNSISAQKYKYTYIFMYSATDDRSELVYAMVWRRTRY